MENRFSNRDFEQFVKQNADQYRMYPSEKVWKNIHHNLHTRRRWYGIGLGLLLLTTAAVTGVMLNPGKKDQIASKKSSPSSATASTKDSKANPKVFIAAAEHKQNRSHLTSNDENLQNRLFFAIDRNEEETNNNDAADHFIASESRVTRETTPLATSVQPDLMTKTAPVYTKKNISNKPSIVAAEIKNNQPVFAEAKNSESTKDEQPVTPVKKDIYPLTIESVVNSYKHAKARKKLSWEVYFTPTISYRKLKENKDFINSTLVNNNALNYYTAIADINSLVTHKPDMGLQLGFNAGYPLSKSLKVLAGLQFNVSKYDIRAYTYDSEVTTIALNTGGGSNSVSTISNYRNFSGDNASWLRNLYISASMPVGLELKLNKNGKTEFGIAATVQPTLMLGDRVYLISTDYKNYAEVPSLTRKWNFSGGFEAFAGLSTGNIQWRIGPHVRYQMLSSFDSKYPVKEHLFDFGLKIGIMLKK